MDYAEISKETIGFLYKSRKSLKDSPLDKTIFALIELRVSQINGCSYCCHIHTEEARKLGVQDEKIDQLPDFSNSSLFSEEEKLAIHWSESVTRIAEDLSQKRELLREFYSEREIVDLTACISLMNAFNRIVLSLK
ncbi:MAG: carboxymuconolactone decarboxylase family protein [Chlamydiota bacterium]|nr:carboxymuconolactone decarboxylase family protein [Chlamydiota bacterium]